MTRARCHPGNPFVTKWEEQRRRFPRVENSTMRHRRAFTLIEVLVVVTIIGILVGITIPAVIKVREVSNRVTCNNNLKVIGLAAINYQEQFRQLPPACTMPYAKRGNPPNIIDIASRFRR